MFRGTQKTELSERNFSAGSYINVGSFGKFMVISDGKHGVNLLNLNTYEVMGKWNNVQDPNFLSEAETRELVGIMDITFTDCDFDPKGMKKVG